jgi:hypothetical protein
MQNGDVGWKVGVGEALEVLEYSWTRGETRMFKYFSSLITRK